MASEVKYNARDCLAVLKNGNPVTDPNDEFLSYVRNTSKSIYCFSMSKHKRDKESEPVVFFDYEAGQWRAGRYIGNIDDYYIGKNGKKQHCSLTIEPRFGEDILFEMFGEIFNLKLSGGKSSWKSNKNSLYIKMLISFIWSQKLAAANRHGLPRNRIAINTQGYSVKGKLMIKPSIFSYGRNRTIISQSHEMIYDEKVIAIVSSAYKVLKRNYAFEQLSLSPNIKNMISDIEIIGHNFRSFGITKKDYQSITYQPIYQSFKDLVDFSWQIINSSKGMDAQNQGSNVSGYLIDMAEVWECYIRSLVQKQLKEFGWKLIDSTFIVYKNQFYGRRIIPDIVLEKDGTFCVFDAKYKKMTYKGIDVDREDFFQIHTYISYMQHLGPVKFAGLLYPVEKDPALLNARTSISTSLYGLEDTKDICMFIADGPIISKENNIDKEHFFEVIKKGIM